MTSFIAAPDAGHLPAREDPWLAHARHQAYSDGYNVSFWQKQKSLRKFGRTLNADSGTKTTVAVFQGNAANEVFATSNTIDSVVSDDAADTGQTIRVEGHYENADGDWVFSVQFVTITGTTPVTLSQPLIRGTRLRNDGSTELVGNVYLYDATLAGTAPLGVPADATATKCMIRAGEQQTAKCATAVSYQDVWAITFVSVSAARGNSSVNVDYEVEYRNQGGVWLPVGLEGSLRSAAAPKVLEELRPYPLIYPNTDVRLVVTSGTDNTVCTGRISGILGRIVTN